MGCHQHTCGCGPKLTGIPSTHRLDRKDPDCGNNVRKTRFLTPFSPCVYRPCLVVKQKHACVCLSCFPSPWAACLGAHGRVPSGGLVREALQMGSTLNPDPSSALSISSEASSGLSEGAEPGSNTQSCLGAADVRSAFRFFF